MILWAVKGSPGLNACLTLTLLDKVRLVFGSLHSEEKRMGSQGPDSLSSSTRL